MVQEQDSKHYKNKGYLLSPKKIKTIKTNQEEIKNG